MKMQLMAIAQANVDKHLGDVTAEYESEEELAFNIYEDVYILAVDALLEEGVEVETCCKVAAALADSYVRKEPRS